MSNFTARDRDRADVDLTAASSGRRATVRRWAWLGLVAQAVFVGHGRADVRDGRRAPER